MFEVAELRAEAALCELQWQRHIRTQWDASSDWVHRRPVSAKPKWGIAVLGLQAALAVFVLQKPASWAQNCIRLLSRNASSNQMIQYQSQNLESRKSLWLLPGAPCATTMRWEAIAASSHGNASKASRTGTSMSPAALTVGFLPPTGGKSRHEETSASPETLVLCPVPELKKTTLPSRDTKYKRIPLESTRNHLLSHFPVEAGLWTITQSHHNQIVQNLNQPRLNICPFPGQRWLILLVPLLPPPWM